jgi:hypothetical protein
MDKLLPELYYDIVDKVNNYGDLKNLAQTNSQFRHAVQHRFKREAIEARRVLGKPIDLTDQQLIERLYYLNDYKDSSPNFIKITDKPHHGTHTQTWSINDNYINSSSISEKWFLNGRLHRIDGPAFTRWSDGQKTLEEWRVNGRLHRIGGPAATEWSDGQTCAFWYNGY